MNLTDPSQPAFNPIAQQGTRWIRNGFPYREVSRNATNPCIVTICGEGFWPITPNFTGTCLEVPLSELKADGPFNNYSGMENLTNR
jgi:hypothetical protein